MRLAVLRSHILSCTRSSERVRIETSNARLKRCSARLHPLLGAGED